MRDFLSAHVKENSPALDGLLWALADEYDLGAVALLAKLAKHDDAAVRQKAVADLARVYRDRKPYAGGWWGTQPAAHGPPPREVDWEGTPAVREAVLAALSDKDAAVRKAASLGLLAVNDLATLEPLEKQFASEKDVETRADLLRAVAGLASPKSADFLTEIAKDGKAPEALRLEAVGGLEKIKAPASAETLAALAAPTEPVAVQVRALTALAVLKAPAGKDAAIKALKSDEPTVRVAAAGAVAADAGANAVDLLTPLLDDKEATVRIAAVQGLGSLKNKAAVPALVKAAGDGATEFDAVQALTQTPDVPRPVGVPDRPRLEKRRAAHGLQGGHRRHPRRGGAGPGAARQGQRGQSGAAARIALHLLRAYADPAMEADRPLPARRQGVSAGDGAEASTPPTPASTSRLSGRRTGPTPGTTAE